MENHSVCPSRREILAAAAVTASLPILDAALNASPLAVAAAPASQSAGWVTTTLKPAELKDNEFTAVADQAVIVTRADKTVTAWSNKCSHRGCAMKPKAGDKMITCTCHNSQFNLDGTVVKAPATAPLTCFAIRVNDKGFIEVDPTQKPAKDAKEAKITIS